MKSVFILKTTKKVKDMTEKLDDISLKILKILQEKARVPNVEVARQINMAPSAVLERIRKLEKQGVIDGYEVILNPVRFNRTFVAFVDVYLSAGADMDEAGKMLTDIAEVQEVHFVAGKDCFHVKVRVSDATALNTLLKERIHASDLVRKTETSVSLATLKETSQIPLETIDPELLRQSK